MYFGNPSPLKFGSFAHVDAEVFQTLRNVYTLFTVTV